MIRFDGKGSPTDTPGSSGRHGGFATYFIKEGRVILDSVLSRDTVAFADPRFFATGSA